MRYKLGYLLAIRKIVNIIIYSGGDHSSPPELLIIETEANIYVSCIVNHLSLSHYLKREVDAGCVNKGILM